MDTRPDAPTPAISVSETAAAWDATPDPLLARPRPEPLDAEAMVRRMHEHFPVIMARLAE